MEGRFEVDWRDECIRWDEGGRGGNHRLGKGLEGGRGCYARGSA